jgi:hypothetical protein
MSMITKYKLLAHVIITTQYCHQVVTRYHNKNCDITTELAFYLLQCNSVCLSLVVRQRTQHVSTHCVPFIADGKDAQCAEKPQVKLDLTCNPSNSFRCTV